MRVLLFASFVLLVSSCTSKEVHRQTEKGEKLSCHSVQSVINIPKVGTKVTCSNSSRKPANENIEQNYPKPGVAAIVGSCCGQFGSWVTCACWRNGINCTNGAALRARQCHDSCDVQHEEGKFLDINYYRNCRKACYEMHGSDLDACEA